MQPLTALVAGYFAFMPASAPKQIYPIQHSQQASNLESFLNLPYRHVQGQEINLEPDSLKERRTASFYGTVGMWRITPDGKVEGGAQERLEGYMRHVQAKTLTGITVDLLMDYDAPKDYKDGDSLENNLPKHVAVFEQGSSVIRYTGTAEFNEKKFKDRVRGLIRIKQLFPKDQDN